MDRSEGLPRTFVVLRRLSKFPHPSGPLPRQHRPEWWRLSHKVLSLLSMHALPVSLPSLPVQSTSVTRSEEPRLYHRAAVIDNHDR